MGVRNPSATQIVGLKLLTFVLCLIPLGNLIWGFYTDNLGANPIETITRNTGEWTLRFLLITLAVTPLRRLSGMNWLLRLRRMLGLYAFFYGCLHLATYLWLDQFFDWPAIVRDIIKRPFITVGFAALLLMLPLALTSFNAAIRWLGGKRWQALHRAVYVVGVLGVVHFWWLVKLDLTEPAIYALILAALLGHRIWWWLRNSKRQQLSAQT